MNKERYWRDKFRKAGVDLDAAPTRISAKAYVLARADVVEHVEEQPTRAAGFRKLALNDDYLDAVALSRLYLIKAATMTAAVLGAN